MTVLNVHERRLAASAAEVGALLDTLATPQDRLWPRGFWPAMRFDGPLAPGASGGHGPIRYAVEAMEPGRAVRFRFLVPRGFDGWHALEIVPDGERASILRHTLAMTPRGTARLVWPLAIRPLHDALLEDALARAEAAVGQTPTVVPWSSWVRLLRFVLSMGRARPQSSPAAPGDRSR